MNLIADGSLPHLSALFSQCFQLSTYQTEDQLINKLATQDILLCRSTLKVSAQLLKESRLQCVATASSGTDHIDKQFLAQHNILLLDAKGCNAAAVADYVLAVLAYLRQYLQLTPKTAGIIGVGMVGRLVAERLLAAGLTLSYCDPLKAQQDNDYPYTELEALSACDLLCIHANRHEQMPYPSVHLIDDHFLSQLKPGCIIINASRGDIVNETALLNTSKKLYYCTDVYSNEPHINPAIIAKASLCTPHIAGHSIEAKQNAMRHLSNQIHRYYGYSPPTEIPPPPHSAQVIRSHWCETVLDMYNPAVESKQMKQATHMSDTFLSLRKAHQHRHDFSADIISTLLL